MSIKVATADELGISAGQVTAFYLAQWTRRLAVSVPDFYAWQFTAGPDCKGENNCIVAYDRVSERITGVLGVNQRHFLLAGREERAAELTSWVVAADYRSTGVGVPMIQLAMERYDVLLAMGVTELSLPVFLRSGFRYLRAIPRFVRVFDIDGIKEVATAPPLAKKLAEQWGRLVPNTRFVARPAGPDDFSALWSRLSPRYSMFSRNPDHLRWRYDNHPAFQYMMFHVQDGAGEALVVLRSEKAVPGLSMLHVVDCIGDDSALPAAFSFVEDFCRREGFHAADFFCTSARINRHLLGGGWFSALDDHFFQFPHLFHPPTLRSPSSTSLVFWTRERMVDLSDMSNLYVTKQDIDFDRPMPTSDGAWQ